LLQQRNAGQRVNAMLSRKFCRLQAGMAGLKT
jgi:hypothetical protein